MPSDAASATDGGGVGDAGPLDVVILGCGYVGRELGRQLAEMGHHPVGVVRSAESAAAVEDAGIEAVRADLTDPESLAAVPDANALVFAASAGRGSVETARELYHDGLRAVLAEFSARDSPPERLVFTSSTGVYGDHGGDPVDEETPVSPASPKAEVITEAEELVREGAIPGTVVRFAGLYGPGRYRLERYLEGPVTEGVRNSIHREDAAGAVAFLLDRGLACGETVLVCDDDPVEKWAFADWLAAECGAPAPPKRTVAEYVAETDPSPEAERRVRSAKRCRNDRLRGLGYDLAYPTVREGYRDAIEAYCSEE